MQIYFRDGELCTWMRADGAENKNKNVKSGNCNFVYKQVSFLFDGDRRPFFLFFSPLCFSLFLHAAYGNHY